MQGVDQRVGEVDCWTTSDRPCPLSDGILCNDLELDGCDDLLAREELDLPPAGNANLLSIRQTYLPGIHRPAYDRSSARWRTGGSYPVGGDRESEALASVPHAQQRGP